MSNDKREKAKIKTDKLLDKIAEGTASSEFKREYFPKDQTIRILSDLKEKCIFSDRKGAFVNDFYKSNIGGPDQLFLLYEFYLKCDSVRLTFGYNLGDEVELFKLGIQPIEENNSMITNQENRLKY
ncbi:hypothetical protein C900_00946 [Fulvivirga imtechensis AK7]|uniref:Uncharacterized protein n=1 Tax=Fulvivirga imtechensis AK7 TaxID=1237149 RepID=L8JIM3_9BACT|nr:hypothetical protein [Fulvivirga imtechensis]ELR68108.1 hypothetical protein C900_00946 [Fulvivirga imtechensis AK7]